MNILSCELYLQDIIKTRKAIVNIEKLRNKKILVTGATGLVCSTIVDILICLNFNIEIYVAGRNETAFNERFGDKVKFIQYDATKEFLFAEDVDYIIHGASNASPNLYLEQPVETMKANIVGVDNLLTFARKFNVKKFVFISSSEVYGKNSDLEPFKENHYGYIDILNPRSSYAVSKRAAETMCSSYLFEYGVDYNIVRLGHIYGPTMSINDKRVSSDFAMKAAMGENIVLKSTGEQIRSYCYCVDCASAILSVMLNGKCGEAYNISNKHSIVSIRRMAEYYARFGKVKLIIDIPTVEERKAFNPMDNSSLNSEKLEELGWSSQFNVEEGFEHTVKILKEIMLKK